MVIAVPRAESAARGAEPKYVGRMLAGRYAILQQIGAGGMARVYRGRHVALGRPVAIKILRDRFAVRPPCVGRFLREARATARIRHANVVEVLDFGQEPDGAVYCVMELLPGEPLAATLAREGSLSWKRAKAVMLQVCDALEAAHSVGVIHRDIKPDNCLRLVTRAGRSGSDDPESERIKLIDFGIAKMSGSGPALGGSTLMGTIMGTADYMAPEQARGSQTDQRTDVYGAGVLLYELLTGQVPFSGSSNVERLAQHLYVLPDPPSEVAPMAQIPKKADAIVLRALSKEPDARFQSMGEMRAAIAELELDPAPAAGESVRHESRPTRGRWRPVRVGLNLMGAAVALLVAATAIPSHDRPDVNDQQSPAPVRSREEQQPFVPALAADDSQSDAGRGPGDRHESGTAEIESRPDEGEPGVDPEDPKAGPIMVRRGAAPPPSAEATGEATVEAPSKKRRSKKRRSKKRRSKKRRSRSKR